MIYVVGSGPSGVAAAFALLEAGAEVTMLDGGVELEADRRRMVGELEHLPKSQWSQESIQEIKKTSKTGAGGIPLKYVYGSDFHYRYSSTYTPVESSGVQVLASLAKGGLSNVWGAAILPYTQRELTDWPVTEKEMQEHYRAITGLIPVSAKNDSLSKLFPLYTDAYHPLDLSIQAKQFLNDIDAQATKLHSLGITYGQARLAVHNSADRHCIYCGLCMYGCPYHLIYSTAENFNRLKQYPNFRYEPGVVVKAVEESRDRVIVKGERLGGGESLQYEGSKVFLGAGVLSTAKIVLNSTGVFDKPIEMKTSQHFLVPMFRHQSVGDVQKQDTHTLAQLFVEVDDPRVSEHLIHTQVYSYMDFFPETMRNKLKFLYPLSKWALDKFFYGRFLLLQGYLHSEESCSIELRLDNAGVFHLQPKENPKGQTIIKKLVKKLNNVRDIFKVFPMGIGSELSPAGVGAHLGGTFPMRKQPKHLETDSLGRLSGFRNLHIIDSSVFPSIPATTITYTIMANAHRIATHALKN